MNDDNFFYGIELEFSHAPSTINIATIAQVADSEDVAKILDRLEIDLHFLREQMFKDQSNDEIVIKPMTLRVFQEHVDVFRALLTSLEALGYRVYGLEEEIGLHVSIDRSKLVLDTLSSLMKFIFTNRNQFLAITRRKNLSSKMGDIDYMLDNPFRSKTEDELNQALAYQMTELEYLYKNKVRGSILGTRLYSNRDYVQFTQFNGTLRAEELLGTIEFLDAAIHFVEKNNDYNWVKFLSFIKTSSRPLQLSPEYKNLFSLRDC